MPLGHKPNQPWKIVEEIGVLNPKKVATNTTLVTLAFSDIFGLSVIADDPIRGNLHIIEEHADNEIDRANNDPQNCLDDSHYTLRVSGYAELVNNRLHPKGVINYSKVLLSSRCLEWLFKHILDKGGTPFPNYFFNMHCQQT